MPRKDSFKPCAEKDSLEKGGAEPVRWSRDFWWRQVVFAEAPLPQNGYGTNQIGHRILWFVDFRSEIAVVL